jgi:hypothetical protein
MASACPYAVTRKQKTGMYVHREILTVYLQKQVSTSRQQKRVYTPQQPALKGMEKELVQLDPDTFLNATNKQV